MPNFEIVLPVLNEAVTLRQQVTHLHNFLSHHFPDSQQWKITIADNGSTDGTAAIAEALKTDLNAIKVISLSRKGVGLALKTAWAASDADIVGYMDLDFSTDLKHFLEAYSILAHQEVDLVYATRLHPKATVIGRSAKRTFTSKVFNFLVKSYFQTRFSDGMCGFKFMKRNVLPGLRAAGANNDGWFFSTELLVTAEWLQLNLHELPVHWTDDVSSSRVKIMPLAQRYLKAMYDLKKLKRFSHQ